MNVLRISTNKRLTNIEVTLTDIKIYMMENLVTKDEFTAFRDNTFTKLDGLAHRIDGLDKERIMSVARTDRLEERIDSRDKDRTSLKK